MRINAKVKVINPVRTGKSKSNGNEWKSQEIVICWKENVDGRECEQYLQVTLRGVSIERFAQLNPVAGETEISGDLMFSTRSINSRVYNDIMLYL